ncbi:MAG: carboxylesterase family protein, partial [Alphaproteobacteria bacterium]|nr:carboxylesterase family protein [Alphaproteobacteria bacterium]
MAFGNGTFTAAGGAVSDLLGGAEKAGGLRISASGQRIQAGAFRLSALGNEQRAQGDEAEAEQYGLAGTLATQNADFTNQSTAIQQVQADRKLTMSLGTSRADIAASGMQRSGSALDILRDSASQGALTKAVLGQQGLITEAGYREEAKSYDVMQAGAGSVCMHLASGDKVKVMFQQAIVQSAGCLQPMKTVTEAQVVGQSL